MPRFLAKTVIDTDRRTAVRHPTLVVVEILTAEGVSAAGAATDISCQGFRMRSPAAFAPGEHFKVRIGAGIARRAVIVWTDGQDAGCKFHRPLSVAMLARFLGA